MGKNNVKTCRIGKVPKSFRYAYSFCKFLFLPQWGKGITIYDKQQGNVEEREAERNMDDGRGSFNYPKEPLLNLSCLCVNQHINRNLKVLLLRRYKRKQLIEWLLLFSYICIEFNNRQKMNMSEFYSEFLFRYQTDAALRKISINA